MADQDDFSPELRDKLRGYYQPTDSATPQEQRETKNDGACPASPWASPADDFVEELLEAARWACDELQEIDAESTRQQLRKEQRALAAKLQAARDAIRDLSPDLDRLLEAGADPVGCAAAIDALLSDVDGAANRIAALPKSDRPKEKEGAIAKELAVRVARVLTAHGMKASASGDIYFGYTSSAIEILRAIGDYIELERDPLTWRNILADAKYANPDPLPGEARSAGPSTEPTQDGGFVINAVRLGLAKPKRRARAKEGGPPSCED